MRQSRAELRQLRRPEDPFVYEAVTVPSFEDGILGVVLNADVQAVVIRDNFRFKSQFDAPLLRTYRSSIFLWNPALWSRKITEWLSPGLFGRSGPSWTFI